MEKEKTGREYKLINYFDVWGNKRDGWEINNQCYFNEYGEKDSIFHIENDATKKEILNYLVSIGFLNTSDMRKLYVDEFSSDMIEIYERKGMKPLCAFNPTY
jgi:hypothetical protein